MCFKRVYSITYTRVRIICNKSYHADRSFEDNIQKHIFPYFFCHMLNSSIIFQGTIPLGNCTKENIKKLDIKEGEVVFRCTRCECIKTDRAHHCRLVII